MLEYKPNIVLSEKDYNIVGKRPIRPDGAEKVTGYATYGDVVREGPAESVRPCAH
jgi:CO/xanthine dehydrogenase Mo-binding subunit